MSLFKAAVYEVVHRSQLGAKALAELVTMSYSMLSNAANENLEDFNLRGDKIVPLTIHSDNFAILDHMELMVGRTAFKLPTKFADPKQLHTHLSKTVGEFSDVLKSFDQAMADGKITATEAKDMEKEAHELIRELLSWVASMQKASKNQKRIEDIA